MTPTKRLLLTSLLLPFGGCALPGDRAPERPAWQQPDRNAQQSNAATSGFGADLRLSEFQSTRPPEKQAQWPQSQYAEAQQAEPTYQSPADSWARSSADSGIQPSIYGLRPSTTSNPPVLQTQPPAPIYEPSPRQQPSALAGAPGASRGLGPGDVVLVSVFGQPDLETSTVVSDAGRITLPLVGAIDVSGLEPQQAEARVAQAFRSGGYLVDPQITLTVEELRSRQISVLGQVERPGRFPLTSRMTLLDALALAGGVSNTGGNDVYLIRQVAGQTRKFEINIDNMLAAPDTRTLLELGAGDTVYVPEAPLFYIYGEVRRPDGYALKPGMTVMQAISVGGGLTDRGSDSRLRIRRRDANGGTTTLRPSLEDTVREGDVIYVKERLF
ncbi:polysaccharide export protein EpsE [bacterium]|nr:polysaccharide export protein EpsE [bacterium]